MRQLSITPSITVTIGRHTRQYFAFVTTAPAELDSPSTVTLHAVDVLRTSSGFAADPDHATTSSARERPHAWSSSRRWSSPGSGPSTAGISTCLLRRGSRCSSASTRCSTGCGSACRRPSPAQVAA